MARKADPATRLRWTRRLAAFDRGNSSVAQFCRRTGISTASFYLWRQKLARPSAARRTGSGLGQAPLHSKLRPATGQGNAHPALSFVPLKVTPPSSMRVRLPDGTQVLVPCHDHRAIRVVIRALAGRPREAR